MTEDLPVAHSTWLLNRPCQWFNVACGEWLNRRHHPSGHLFRGRYKSVTVDESSWQEVAPIWDRRRSWQG